MFITLQIAINEMNITKRVIEKERRREREIRVSKAAEVRAIERDVHPVLSSRLYLRLLYLLR